MNSTQANLYHGPRKTGLLHAFEYRELLRGLVGKELKLKYRGSILGFLWSLLNPLTMVLVYSLVFRFFLRVRADNYALFLIIGIIHWEFVSASLSSATRTIVDNGGLIRRIAFPRMILPVSIVSFEFIKLLFAIAVVALAFIPLGGKVWAGVLLYLPVLALLFLFTSGLALLIASLTVYYRDLEHLIEVGLRLFFWLTPIVYPLTSLPENLRGYFYLNPVMPFILAFQDLAYHGTMPALSTWGLCLTHTCLFLALGYLVFNRLEIRFAEEV